ncbi:hypothetical protein M501DRAFT_1014336 [Patellaria atrata CBS 101060]|uniref:Uncharacterized protein n=1 Tax=Patellaria atrata CBS 101060 TaxID=1346257 RepID=A0A9P4SF54_9PEZI|nr:hypothetical protein M501DRAFT_1014336 [Patellaria atrata CBS 101060]
MVRDPSAREQDFIFDSEELPMVTEIVKFRATTACVIIALISYLAPDTFTTVLHHISLQLFDERWIDSLCTEVDRSASSRVSIDSAVLQLAAIREGYDFNDTKITDNSVPTIGYRNGAFSILPTLLLKMEPTAESLGLSCTGRFLANLILSLNGKIQANSPPISVSEDFGVKEMDSLVHNISALEMIDQS